MSVSSYYTVLQIENNLGCPLFNGKAEITHGSLGVKLVDIPKGGTSAKIRIEAKDADTGSNGKLTYEYTEGGKTKWLSFVFKCDNSDSDEAKVVAQDPSSLETGTSPYNPTDHPLTVTYRVGEAK